jgi:hypothetical protein
MDAFGKSRPNDIGFVTKCDLLQGEVDAFGGIEGWDDLAFHVRACPLCQRPTEALG